MSQRDLSKMTDEELAGEFKGCIGLIVVNLLRAAELWEEMIRRKMSVPKPNGGIERTIPQIAAHRLAAEAVVAFAHRFKLLRALEGLPLDVQKNLAAGGEIEMADPDNPRQTISIPLDRLPANMIKVVFGDGEVRTPALQRVMLRGERKRPIKRVLNSHPILDRETGMLRWGGRQMPQVEALNVMSAAAGPDKPPPADLPNEYVTFHVRLNKAEHKRFIDQCKRDGLPDWDIARKALRAFGYL